MRKIYKIASLSINGIGHPTRISMLEEFLWHQDTDIALLQEVTNRAIENTQIHKTHQYRHGTRDSDTCERGDTD
jgi:exonuclease III